MKVKMRKTTNWNKKLCRPGDTLTVNEAVAKRWERNGIASIVEGKKAKEPPKETTGE